MLIHEAHLTYCTNIHAGETWEEHFDALKQNFPIIKQQVSPELPMGIGLRLSNMASLELIKTEHTEAFKHWLSDQNAYVFTMNGFPYGSFHHTKVKEQVHSPDWTTADRVDYTLRLFKILLALLPAGLDGGISTSPLSYRHWFSHSEKALGQAKITATHNILKVALQLIQIKLETSVVLHLDIEPEPDGILETGLEFTQWYNEYLLPQGIMQVKEKFACTSTEAEMMIKEHICLCYDVCHFAVGYEKHTDVVKQLNINSIKIGKIQISAALKADLLADNKRSAVIETFSDFNESTYLHQVVARKIDQSLIRYRDLPDAIADAGNLAVAEWRAHFHVPVFTEDFGPVQSTRSDITRVLDLHNQNALTRHLEVETYTWQVLPEALKLPLPESIIREMTWVKNQLSK